MLNITTPTEVGHASFAEGITRDELTFANAVGVAAVRSIVAQATSNESAMRMTRAMTALLASSLLELEPKPLPDQADRWLDHRADVTYRRRTIIGWACFAAACAVGTFLVWKLSGRTI